MSNTNQRAVAETVFDRTQRRETEIDDALKQEYARREAAVKNMYRLRALRLERDAKSKNEESADNEVIAEYQGEGGALRGVIRHIKSLGIERSHTR